VIICQEKNKQERNAEGYPLAISILKMMLREGCHEKRRFKA